MELRQNEGFIKNAFNRAVFPCMMAMLSANINVIVDGILVSNMIGESALAAINLSLPLYLALCVVGSFVAYGSANNAALELGNNRSKQANEYYQTAFNALIILSLIITVLGVLFNRQIVSLLCAEPDIQKYVREYVVITLIGALPKILIYIPYGYLRLDGRNTETFIMMFVMTVGNIILDIVFVAGLGLGVFGAGLASVIATAIACAMGIYWLCDKKSSFKYALFMSKRVDVWKKISATGSPYALNNIFSTVKLLIINGILLAYGGAMQVAIFTALNGMLGFGECITLGIPQAGTAILGVCRGENDNGSMRLLFNRQLKSGIVFLMIITAFMVGGADYIARAYGLSVSIYFPMFFLCAGMFFALFNGLLSTFYNITGRYIFSNLLIGMRVIIMTWISLLLSIKLWNNPWPFLLISEVLSVVFWLIVVSIYQRRHPEYSKYLLLNDRLEREGKVLNFTVKDSKEDICLASERISEFFEENGLSPKSTFKISMALEEILVLVKKKNDLKHLHFDLRAYAVDDVVGMRFRYDGKMFNPFQIPKEDPEDEYMGVKTIEKLVEIVYYTRTFGTNTVQVILSEDTSS